MSRIRILVAEAEGSVPREAGAVMWVWADGFSGTIGGGALELEAIIAGRKMLTDNLPALHRELHAYPLGPALGQCCGGMVRLLFELVGTVGTAGAPAPLEGEGRGGGAATRTDVLGAKDSLTQALLPRPLPPTPNLPLKGGGGGPALVVRPLVAGFEPAVVRDRKIAPDWPIPVLRAVRQMLSGERPRTTLLIRGGKGAPDYIIEPEPQPPHPLYLYGAGHVGRAVVRALTDLPFAITWVDVAADRFPEGGSPQVTPVVATDPSVIAATAPPDALHLIMTFSHALDLAICHAVLARDFAWAGLIGSRTKRARFDKRLREAGIGAEALGRLVCPIGIGDITGKEPAMIAISVAAQLAAWSSSTRAQVHGSEQHDASA